MKKLIVMTLVLVMVLSMFSAVAVSAQAVYTETVTYDFTKEADFNRFKTDMNSAEQGITVNGIAEGTVYSSEDGLYALFDGKKDDGAITTTNNIKGGKIRFKKGYKYTISYEGKTNYGMRLGFDSSIAVNGSGASWKYIKLETLNEWTKVSETFIYTGEDADREVRLLFINNNMTADTHYYSLKNLTIKIEPQFPNAENNPSETVNLWNQYSLNDESSYENVKEIMSANQGLTVTYEEGALKALFDGALDNGSSAVTSSDNLTLGTTVEFKAGYTYTLSYEGKSNKDFYLYLSPNFIANGVGAVKYENGNGEWKTCSATWTPTETKTLTGSSSVLFFTFASTNGTIANESYYMVKNLKLVEKAPTTSPYITLGGLSQLYEDTTNENKPTAIVYGTINNYTTNADGTYGIEVSTNISGTDYSIKLPMLASDGSNANIVVGGKFAFKVFGSAIDMNKTYNFRPFIGEDYAGEMITLSSNS